MKYIAQKIVLALVLALSFVSYAVNAQVLMTEYNVPRSANSMHLDRFSAERLGLTGYVEPVLTPAKEISDWGKLSFVLRSKAFYQEYIVAGLSRVPTKLGKVGGEDIVDRCGLEQRDYLISKGVPAKAVHFAIVRYPDHTIGTAVLIRNGDGDIIINCEMRSLGLLEEPVLLIAFQEFVIRGGRVLALEYLTNPPESRWGIDIIHRKR